MYSRCKDHVAFRPNWSDCSIKARSLSKQELGAPSPPPFRRLCKFAEIRKKNSQVAGITAINHQPESLSVIEPFRSRNSVSSFSFFPLSFFLQILHRLARNSHSLRVNWNRAHSSEKWTNGRAFGEVSSLKGCGTPTRSGSKTENSGITRFWNCSGASNFRTSEPFFFRLETFRASSSWVFELTKLIPPPKFRHLTFAILGTLNSRAVRSFRSSVSEFLELQIFKAVDS